MHPPLYDIRSEEMLNQFSRTELLLGKEAMERLENSRVAVFGVGGVGGYVCEALVRSGVGAFDLIDDDKVCLTNLNRQIIATRKTVGKYKVDVMKERILEINPKADVRIHKTFFLPENADEFPFEEYDYVVDAVDTVTAKLELVMKAKEKNIPVVNVPTYGTQIVGQYALGLLLEICSHYGHHDETVKAGKWENNDDWCYWDYPMIELYGKTAGIIGLGRIGQATAKLLNALDMKVLAYDAYQSEAGAKLAEYVSLDELFAQSDVIFLHCPLFPETEGMINKENIAKMKDGVILINNSRGQLVVEQDLADALNSGKVYAAGLDVVSTEPIKGDNPLLKAKNCIITPHISWAAQASRQRIMDITVDNIKAFLAGNTVNRVNK